MCYNKILTFLNYNCIAPAPPVAAPVPVGVPGAMGVLQPQAPALQPQLVDVPGKT